MRAGEADEATALVGGWSVRGAEGSVARQRRWAGSGEKEKAFELRQQTEGFKENRLRVGAQTGVKVTFVF